MPAGILLLCTVVTLLGAACGDFVLDPNGTCTDQNYYTYHYNVTEEYYESELLQTSTSIFTFGVQCFGTGTYFGESALVYNLTDVAAIDFSGTLANEMIENGDDVNATIQDLTDSLQNGHFSFVLVTNGTNAGLVPIAFYDTTEEDEIVNIKKTLAASFQAEYSFVGTAARTELDPQALHNTTYTMGAPDCTSGLFCETREILDSDINGFASAIPNEVVDYYSRDTIKVKDVLVVSEEGTMTMKIVQPEADDISARGEITPEEIILKDSVRAKLHKRQTSAESIDDSYDPNIATNHYVTTAKYNMNQTGTSQRVKRSTESEQLNLKNMANSSLLISINQTRKAISVMKKWRQQLGDITDALVRLHHDTKQTDIASKIESLVKMEAKYGPAPGFTPAVDDVIDYLEMLIGSTKVQDVNMRLLLYYILSPEGSLPAQMAILNGFENAVDDEEEEKVLFYVAFMANPQPQVVARVEQLISPDATSKDPILLAYSSMVPRASPELQQRMVSFILDRLPMAEGSTNSLIHHILALGNTESLLARNHLMDYLDYPDQAVQLAAIFSLGTILHDPMVQTTFNEIVTNPETTTSHVAMIAQALAQGAQQAQLRNYSKLYPAELVQSLILKAATMDDDEIYSTLSSYLADINTAKSRDLLRLLYTIVETKLDNTRVRRGTIWDEQKSTYNLVAPWEERNNDVKTYTNHHAYIWGFLIGVSDINVQFAAGAFVGVANNGAYKVFGRALAQGKVYDKKTNFLEFTVMRKKTDVSTESILFGKVMGKVLKDIDMKQESSVCKTFTEPLYNGPVYTVFDFSYGIYVKLGTLDLKVKATTQFDAGLEVAFCENMGNVTAGAKLTPTINFKVNGESDHVFAKILKAGVTTDAEITYRLLPSVSSMVCYTQSQIRWKNCIGVYHQRRESSIKQYAWYAWRGWCGWKLCGGDQAYQNKKKIENLSFEWSLPETAVIQLAEKCDSDFVCK